jgi:hypothetical protein
MRITNALNQTVWIQAAVVTPGFIGEITTTAQVIVRLHARILAAGAWAPGPQVAVSVSVGQVVTKC